MGVAVPQAVAPAAQGLEVHLASFLVAAVHGMYHEQIVQLYLVAVSKAICGSCASCLDMSDVADLQLPPKANSQHRTEQCIASQSTDQACCKAGACMYL